MKRVKNLFTSALCVLLGLALVLGGCAQTIGTQGNLMAGVRKKTPSITIDLEGPSAQSVTGFGLELFRRSMEACPGQGVLVSPLSVLSAMTMTANGASGQTLAQMEEVLGLPVDKLRAYLSVYGSSLPSADKYRFHTANSLWVRDGLDIQKDFLQLNADYFGAGVFQEPFDEATKDKINGWVKENTHEMIPTIIERIPSDAVLFLINALAFEAEWAQVYDDIDVRKDRTFTREDGTQLSVDMMLSEERGYLEDDHATGFLKYYADEKYAFAALLPKEGTSLAEYVGGLTGESLRELLTHPVDAEVIAAIPKFDQEYDASLRKLFIDMGMSYAFDADKADFSAMGSANGDSLYIDDVLHKTYISVFEQGTRAGAATAVILAEGAAEKRDFKEVTLDRPFLYMIIDTETCLPLFMGAAYAPEAK